MTYGPDFDTATLELASADGYRDRRLAAAFLAGFEQSTSYNYGATIARIEDQAWFDRMGHAFDRWYAYENAQNPRNRWSGFPVDDLKAIRDSIFGRLTETDDEHLARILDEIEAEIANAPSKDGAT